MVKTTDMRQQDADRAAEIGARISALIVERGLDRNRIADAIGQSRSAVDKLVHGEGAVQFAKLCRLAEALGTTPDYILGFSEQPAASSRPAAGSRSGIPDSALLTAIAAAFDLLSPRLDRDASLLLARDVLAAAGAAQVLASPDQESLILAALVAHEVRKRGL